MFFPSISASVQVDHHPPFHLPHLFLLFLFSLSKSFCELFVLFSLFKKNLNCKLDRLTSAKNKTDTKRASVASQKRNTVALNPGVCIFPLYLSPLLIIVLFSEQICHIHGDRAGLLSFRSNSSHK